VISGPVLALTPEGVREHLRRDASCIESGLVLLRDGILTPDGVKLDGLGRDAQGVAVAFLFALDGQHPASRVLAAREFLRRSGRALERAIPDLGLGIDGTSRILVLGTAVPSQWIDDLRRMGLAGVDVWQLENVFVHGTRRLLVQPLLGSAAHGAEDTFDVPSGTPGSQRPLAAELLRIVQKLDPQVAVRGDRFRRVVWWCQHPLGTLVTHETGARFEPPASDDGDRDESVFLASMADVHAAADGVLRRFIQLALPPSAAAPKEPAPVAARSLDYDLLRQSAAAAQVSAAEFQALAAEGDPMVRREVRPRGASGGSSSATHSGSSAMGSAPSGSTSPGASWSSPP